MNTTISIINRLRFWSGQLTGQKGNAIAYILMVLIIFGVIGVVMTSLLTSSVVSTTTPNHSRRALYMTEAGMRYGLSQLRNEEFATGVIDDLNNLTYTVSPEETFTLNVFGPWFDSASDQTFIAGGNMTLNVPVGKLPQEFTMPANIWAVNLDYIGSERPSETTMRDTITAFTRVDDTTLTITVSNDITVSDGERVCLAVQPTQTPQAIGEGSDLYIAREAKDYFPQYGGAIEISRRNYAYETLEDDPGNNRAILRNLSYNKMPNSLPALTTVEILNNGHYTGDWIILSPKNYTIIPTGTSESISAGGTMNEAISTYDQYTVKPDTRNPDIDADDFTDHINELETPVPGYLSVDPNADSLSLGGNYNPPTNTAYGAAWYDADKAVGGDDDYCAGGACIFGLGFRTFFTLDYTGTGDGLTFTFMNSVGNDTASIGGDIEQSELLAYAGDSRTNVAGTAWLDGTGDGLQPPKMAVEFDALTNFDAAFESAEPLNYCVASNLKPNTRNDPLTGDKDAVQYVYWGNDTLDIPCRGDKASYDDNRHDAEGSETSDWPAPAPTAGDVRSKPLISPDKTTLYVATIDGDLHAIDIANGTVIWTFPASDPAVGDITVFTGNPAINDAGDTVYVAGEDSGRKVWAVNTSDGTKKWIFPDDDPAVSSIDNTSRSSPAVDRNGVIYIGESDGSSDGNVRAIWPNGIQKWIYDVNEEVESDMVADRTGGAWDGYIYVGDDSGTVIQFSPDSADGTPEWREPGGTDIEATVAVSPDGSIVYAVTETGTVLARNAVDGSSVSGWTNPDTDGYYQDNGIAIDTSGGAYHGTIYIMTSAEDGSGGAYLSSVKADGTGFNWERVPVGSPQHSKSTPEVGPDGTIYVGTDENHVYAIDPSDGSVKWSYDLIGNVRSSPAVGDDGTVYIGSDANKVWAFGNLARPRNRKDLYITSTGAGINVQVAGEDVDVDSPENWLAATASKKRWAVRLEVMRSLVANGLGNYEYTLRSWVRQCDQLDCSDVLGTFYQDTRIEYNAKAPHLEQTVELSLTDHDDFARFLFGFTTATASLASQNAVIESFQLSFIRPGDPVIAADPDWP
jgi:outer membrane protein assembly factor BamB